MNGFKLDHDPVSYPEPISYPQEQKKPTVSSQKTVIKKVETKKEVEPIKVTTISNPVTSKKVGPLMMEYGFTQEETIYIGNWCKDNASNPLHCKAMISHACKQETNCGTAGVGTRNNLFGTYIGGEFPSYVTRFDSIKDWLDRYAQYRHKNSCSQMLSRSRYCTHDCKDRVSNCNLVFDRFENE